VSWPFTEALPLLSWHNSNDGVSSLRQVMQVFSSSFLQEIKQVKQTKNRAKKAGFINLNVSLFIRL
jgi:hypothetical protein